MLRLHLGPQLAPLASRPAFKQRLRAPEVFPRRLRPNRTRSPIQYPIDRITVDFGYAPAQSSRNMQKPLPTALLIGALLAMRLPCGAATPSLTTLYSFTGTSTGAFPEAAWSSTRARSSVRHTPEGTGGARCSRCHNRAGFGAYTTLGLHRRRRRLPSRRSIVSRARAAMERIPKQVWS